MVSALFMNAGCRAVGFNAGGFRVDVWSLYQIELLAHAISVSPEVF
jgi:hypothetical protein